MGEATRLSARDRMIARRRSGFRPSSRRSFFGSVVDEATKFGGAAFEQGKEMVSGIGSMVKNAALASPLNPHTPSRITAQLEVGESLPGMVEPITEQMSRPENAGMFGQLGAFGKGLGEIAAGIPFRKVATDFEKGDYAEGLGHAAPGAALLALGAAAGRPKPAAPAPVPKPTPKLLPATAGPTGVGGGSRFVAGERGLADAARANVIDVQPVTPDFSPGQGTVLPHEVNRLQPVAPDIAATYSGAGEIPTRNVRSSAGIDPLRSEQAMAFEALVPNRYKSVDNFNPYMGEPVGRPDPAFFPSADPTPLPSDPTHWSNNPMFKGGEIGEVAEVGAAPAPKPAPPVRRAKTARSAAVTPEIVDTPPPVNAKPINQPKPVNQPRPKATGDRPYATVSDGDLQTLAKIGDQKAIQELATRAEGNGGFYIGDDGIAVEPVNNQSFLGRVRDKLTDQTGAVGPGADELIRQRRTRQLAESLGARNLPPDQPLPSVDPGHVAPVSPGPQAGRALPGGTINTLREIGLAEDEIGRLSIDEANAIIRFQNHRGTPNQFVSVPQVTRDLESPLAARERIRGGSRPTFGERLRTTLTDESGSVPRSSKIKDGITNFLKDEDGSAPVPQLGKIDFDAPVDAGGGKGNFFHRVTGNLKFDTNFANWVNARHATTVEGVLKRREFKDLDGAGLDGIKAFQAGIKSGRFKDVADYFNKKHALLENIGVKLGFRENYLPQLWENTADEVFQVKKRLGLQPQFTLERVLENYQKGIAEGLKPKYKTIGELIGWYEQRANKTIADRQFFDFLRETKQILPDGKAPDEWELINPKHFPVQRFTSGKQYHTKNYYAPRPVADAINNYLGEGRGFEKWIGDKASLTKNIVLSSGLPIPAYGKAADVHLSNLPVVGKHLPEVVGKIGLRGTGFSAHGANVSFRHVLGNGLIKGGTEAAKWIVNPRSAKAWLDENLVKAPEFVKGGLTLTTEDHLIGETGSVHLLREPKTRPGKIANKGLNALLKGQGAIFEDPLFQNIIPAMKLKHASGLADDFVKQGMSREQAVQAASKATNELYGGINWEAMQRSRNLQNLLRGVVLAPDWFETQYRIGKGMGKTLLDPKNPRGIVYKRAAANLVGAYLLADVTNYAINGQHMWENPPGHALDIKAGTVGGKTRYIRPFGTAADFARLPFDTLAGALQGDLSAPVTILKNRRSTLFRLGTNIGMNQDDFGSPILGDDKFGRPQPIVTQLGKLGREVGEFVTPQYLSGSIDYATGRANSKEEAILGSVEAPVRYSRDSTRRRSRNRPQRVRPSRRR